MSSQQHNPELHHDTTVYEIGKGAAWFIAILFFGSIIALTLSEQIRAAFSKKENDHKAPLVQLASWSPGKGALIDHLHTVERDLDKSWYSTFMRQSLQAALTSNFYEGNQKVSVGYDGWLYYKADLRALTGFGPLKPEPFSVMKDPELARLPETRDVIVNFSKQLEERGVKLLLVPLPLKPMIYPEYLAPQIQKEWITHPDAPAYYEELRKDGIAVLDLTADIAKVRSKRRYVYVREPDRKDKEAVAQAEADAKKLQEAFLKQDTHWTPEAMRVAAEKVADYVRQNFPEAAEPSPTMIRALDAVDRKSMGDLVNLLDLKNSDQYFTAEDGVLRVIGEGTQDKNSNVVLLGDSFVNIFDDPSLGFDDPNADTKTEKRLSAGFAQHLSLLLQKPLDVLAMNGRGSTGVRREFARRFDNEVRAKKLVVWVIASRDILLSRTAAHQANIEWAHVQFNPNQSAPVSVQPADPTQPAPAAQKIVIEATLAEKSPNQDPNGSPYRDALHAAVYDVNKVVEGNLDAAQVIGIQWTFRDKAMQPTADFAVGKRYKLTIVPWDSKTELQLLNLEDTTTVFDAARWFVESAEEIP